MMINIIKQYLKDKLKMTKTKIPPKFGALPIGSTVAVQ